MFLNNHRKNPLPMEKHFFIKQINYPNMLKTSKQAGKPPGFTQWTSGSRRCRELKGGGTRLKKRSKTKRSKTKVSPVVRETSGSSVLRRE